MDAFPLVDSSNTLFSSKQEDEDDWVIVKKQKISILIPPLSPPRQQIETELKPKPTMQSKAAKRRSIVKENKHSRPSRSRHQKTTSLPSKGKSDQDTEEILRTHLDVLEPRLQPPEFSFGGGNIGAIDVVNRRIRARNLQRKLQQLGGLQSLLASQGLDRFAAVFKRRKMSQYQLVNLTMSKLKDMGMNAVGPRRKLIHAIDLLCQPYFSRSSNECIRLEVTTERWELWVWADLELLVGLNGKHSITMLGDVSVWSLLLYYSSHVVFFLVDVSSCIWENLIMHLEL